MRFRNFVIQNFPFLEDDFDALTDYQLFCKMVAYVKKLYINNEKLLKEITANLEQMYEDGKFDSLIEEIVNLQTTFTFDTVSDMKDATNLVNGCYTKTLGYNSINDGGNSYYKIRNKSEDDTIDEVFIIEIDENLVAELIVLNNEINVKQGGLSGNALEDATDILTSIFSKGYNIYFPKGTYNVTNTLTLLSQKLRGDNNESIIKLNSETNKQLIYANELSNVEITNLKFDLGELTDSLQSNINLFSTNGLLIKDCEFIGGYGTQVRLNGSTDVLIENCYFHNVGGDDTNPGEGVYCNGITNLTMLKCKSDYLHDHILYLDGSGGIDNVLVSNCYIKRSGYDMITENGAGIAVYGNAKNVTIENSIFDSCRNGINVARRNNILPSNIFINNNHIYNSEQDAIYSESNGIYIRNNILNDNGYNGLDLRNGNNYYISNNICYNNTTTGINIRNGENIVISDCTMYDNTSSGITIGYNVSNICSHVKISNCIAYGTDANKQLSGIQILNSDDVTITTCKSYGNTVNYDTQRSTSTNLVSQLNSDRESTVNSLMYRSAIPNTGSYNRGDTILFTSPSAGGSIGAVCVTAGSPGTWKTFGNISS